MKKTVTLSFLLILCFTAVAVPASAQSAGNVSIPDVGNVSVLDGGETNIEVQLTQQTWISDYEFRPEEDTVVIRFQTNRSAPTGVTVQELVPIRRADGAVEVVPQEYNIRPNGTTVVTAKAREFEGCQGFSASTRYQRSSNIVPSDACTADTIQLQQYDVLGGWWGIVFGAFSVPVLIAALVYLTKVKSFSLRRF